MNKREEKLRIKAIKRYLGGEEPSSIYRDLNRSKSWFFRTRHFENFHQLQEEEMRFEHNSSPFLKTSLIWIGRITYAIP